jgi:hypothetical protein
VWREDAILKLYPRLWSNAGVTTGKIMPPTPVLHPIRAKISPDFGPGASNGWRCFYGIGVSVTPVMEHFNASRRLLFFRSIKFPQTLVFVMLVN